MIKTKKANRSKFKYKYNKDGHFDFCYKIMSIIYLITFFKHYDLN
jgi:hypothetical protein